MTIPDQENNSTLDNTANSQGQMSNSIIASPANNSDNISALQERTRKSAFQSDPDAGSKGSKVRFPVDSDLCTEIPDSKKWPRDWGSAASAPLRKWYRNAAITPKVAPAPEPLSAFRQQLAAMTSNDQSEAEQGSSRVSEWLDGGSHGDD